MFKAILLLIFLSIVPKATAEGKPLDIVVGPWPPFLSEDQRHQGFIAHLIKDVFSEEGYEVTFHFRPWSRAYHEAANGTHQATAVWMHKEEREEDFLYSKPVLQEEFVFFHLKDTAFEWRTLFDLTGMRVGGTYSYSYGPDFDEAAKKGVFYLERVRSTRQNPRRLLAGRIDVYPEEINVGYYWIQRDLDTEQAARITHHHRPLLQNYSYILFPRVLPGSAELKTNFDRRLQAFRDSGRYATYFEAFRRGEYEPLEDPPVSQTRHQR